MHPLPQTWAVLSTDQTSRMYGHNYVVFMVRSIEMDFDGTTATATGHCTGTNVQSLAEPPSG